MLAAENSFYSVFGDNMAHIVVSVCMNLIKTTASEAELIMNDPTEFINLSLDCCDKQKSNVMKSQACKLLENMCDHVDGATTCVTTFACNALNLALQTAAGKQPNMIAQQGLWGKENDPFLSSTPPIIVAETCLVVLTVISYILPKKDHLVPFFQEALA